MKLRFEAMGKPLGQGNEKKIFVDPENEAKVISVMHSDEGSELKLAPREMKASYYLTKIVRSIVPESIPDIYRAGKLGEEGAFVRERVSHDAGHAALQAARSEGNSEVPIKEKMAHGMSKEIFELTNKLEEAGFGFDIDEDMSNYSRDNDGLVKYLEHFNAWEQTSEGPELKFGKDELEEAISKISDENQRKTSERYLARILELFEEEKAGYAAKKAVESALDNETEIKEVEDLVAAFEAAHSLDALRAITTAEEALASELRRSAVRARIPVINKIREILNKEIPEDKKARLMEMFRNIDASIGSIRNGKVEHRSS